MNAKREFHVLSLKQLEWVGGGVSMPCLGAAVPIAIRSAKAVPSAVVVRWFSCFGAWYEETRACRCESGASLFVIGALLSFLHQVGDMAM
ncbi:hypothetical protein [Comamonas sp.]